MDIVETIKSLISDNKLKESLDVLEDKGSFRDQEKFLLSFRQNYMMIEDDRIRGLLTTEEYKVKRLELSDRVFHYVRSAENGSPVKSTSNRKRPEELNAINTKNLDWFNDLFTCARCVGLIGERVNEGKCTAVLVNASFLITANLFSAEAKEFTLQLDGQMYSLSDSDIMLTDPKTSVMIFDVRRISGLQLLPRIRVMTSMEQKIGDTVNIIQYAASYSTDISISIRNNMIFRLGKTHFLHTAPTSAGSAGAPIFNDSWNLFGIHLSKVPNMNDQGEWLKKDGTVAIGNDDYSEIDWIGKEGIFLYPYASQLNV